MILFINIHIDNAKYWLLNNKVSLMNNVFGWWNFQVEPLKNAKEKKPMNNEFQMINIINWSIKTWTIRLTAMNIKMKSRPIEECTNGWTINFD